MTWSPLGSLGEAKAFCRPLRPGHRSIPAPEEVGAGGAGVLAGEGIAAAQRASRPRRATGSSKDDAEPTVPMPGRAMGFPAAV